jgi:hypothetical protein
MMATIVVVPANIRVAILAVEINLKKVVKPPGIPGDFLFQSVD